MLLFRQEDALELVERQPIDGDLRMDHDGHGLRPLGLCIDRGHHRACRRDHDESQDG